MPFRLVVMLVPERPPLSLIRLSPVPVLIVIFEAPDVRVLLTIVRVTLAFPDGDRPLIAHALGMVRVTRSGTI